MTARTSDTLTAPPTVRHTTESALNAEQVAERFEQVTAMIEAGNPGAARRATVKLAAAADDATADLLRSCLQALERPRPVAVARLRRLWQDSDPAGRVLVEACVPREPALPAPAATGAPRWARPTGVEGPIQEHATRQGPARGRRSRAEADRARDAHRYATRDAEPGGVDALSTDPDADARVSDYPGWVDDELPALTPVRGTVCLSCWVERSTAEQRRVDDDGLCGECRERGAVGITSPGGDRASRVQARAAHIAALATSPEHARSLLRGEWNRARGTDRSVLVAWVQQHLPA